MPISVAAPSDRRREAALARAAARAVFVAEARRAAEVSIVMAGDQRLRELNRQWRGIDRATDVLSFNYDEGSRGWREMPVRGDLVISMERVEEQAKRFRVTPARELARLVVHGALHLCGHDHQREAERRAMRTRENAVLRTLAGAIRRADSRS
jgi:probable rRNA maturation factor